MTEIYTDRCYAHEERRKNGMFFTSKANIQKVINPLFMDGLRGEFKEIKGIRGHEERKDKLTAFHDKLSRLQFFDPACGSGNFLTETYMELRALEDEVIDLENSIHDLDKEVKVSLSQFHGIELNPYAAMVAKTALQIAREQALEKSYQWFKDTVRTPPHFLPLKDETKGIVCGNALTMDWSDLVTPSPDLFIFGNPPYKGFEYQTPSQKKELDMIFGGKRCGTFDYCAAWTFKAAKFLNGSGAHFAFVTTSSIVQGTQATPLLKPIFDMGWKISFAYPAFMWDLQGAAVAVVIIGMAQNSKPPYRLWDNEEEDFVEVENISQYLTDLPTLFVTSSKNPNMPKILNGSIASDGGGLILEDLATKEEAEKDPEIAKYIRPFKGARNLIHDTERWCLWLKDSTPHERQSSEFWQKRAPIVKEAREGTDKADKPLWLFANDRQPSMTYLAIPRTVSEKRPYVLADFLPAEVIADNDLFTCTEEPELAFAIVESLMFMAWQDLVGGRLKKDNRFGGKTYSSFPLPNLTSDQKDVLIEAGREILEARAEYSDSSLLDLYDPENMPDDLKKAHRKLDKAMDRVFSLKPFNSEEERQKALLEAYEKMTGTA